VQLTARGTDEAAKLHALGNSHIGAVLQNLSAEEVQSIIQGLDRYVHALQRHEWLSQITIRPIERRDNAAMADIIKTAMTEFGAVGPGYSIVDDEVNAMFESYSPKRCAYWVAVRNGTVIGGAGIAPLKEGDTDTCELKKMYFRAEARGKGLGGRLIRLCLDKARELRYRRCYLETLQRMTAANKLYEHHGFEKLPKPMGNTGHYKTDNWYVKEL
jgi:putative acetyltransferase